MVVYGVVKKCDSVFKQYASHVVWIIQSCESSAKPRMKDAE